MAFLFIHLLAQAPLDHGSEMALSDSGFESGGKRNFLHITDKDGEQPQCASVSETQRNAIPGVESETIDSPVCRRAQDESGTADSSGLDDSSQERFIGPLPRDGTVGCSGDYSSPSYSYSAILSKSETGELFINF